VRSPGRLADLFDALDRAVAEELPAAVALRHDLHANAELSGAELRTAQTVARALGDPTAPVVADTGRLVRIGPADATAVAVRAELDALPIAEETWAPYASRTGAMHACGHDVHLAALTALGRAVRAVGAPLPLVALLQPREETYPSGARDVVADPLLGAQRVVAYLGVHLQPQLPAGLVSATPGPVNAAVDEVRITVTGEGGHAGYPQTARDPVLALAHVVVALQHLVSRRTDPMHAAVLSVSQLAAGHAFNVLPVTATAGGSLRALLPSDMAVLHRALRDTVACVAQAYGCRGDVQVVEGEPALVNDAGLAAAATPWLARAGLGPGPDFRSCGADDFAHYCAAGPALMMFLGTGTGDPAAPGLHHSRFLPSDEAVGAAARALLAGYVGVVGRARPDLAR
jgi:amidohydrolase